MERLKGKKQIEQLFVTGNSVGAFPLRMVYLETTDKHLVGVSVSKKYFKLRFIFIYSCRTRYRWAKTKSLA